MGSVDTGKIDVMENFEWNVENEIKLFEAMIGHKPVGINKHFHMACISEKFENILGKPVSSDVLWQHLNSMYDLPALDKKESIPFFNIQEEFSLPESEYSELMKAKLLTKIEIPNEVKEATKEVKSMTKNTKDSTPAKAEVVVKKEKQDPEEVSANNDADKKDAHDSENDSKKGKLGKEVKTRGKRSLKEKKTEEDLPTTPILSNKKDELNTSNSSSNKKEKQAAGKRTLRLRADDTLPNKSLTPPPTKRARRI